MPPYDNALQAPTGLCSSSHRTLLVLSHPTPHKTENLHKSAFVHCEGARTRTNSRFLPAHTASRITRRTRFHARNCRNLVWIRSAEVRRRWRRDRTRCARQCCWICTPCVVHKVRIGGWRRRGGCCWAEDGADEGEDEGEYAAAAVSATPAACSRVPTAHAAAQCCCSCGSPMMLANKTHSLAPKSHHTHLLAAAVSTWAAHTLSKPSRREFARRLAAVNSSFAASTASDAIRSKLPGTCP
eukprot:44931-Rhodomonas_salina.1